MDGAEDVPADYRRGVGIMLVDGRARVFVAQRIDMPSESWQMPQGGIDAGEMPGAAAMRELAEEVGTNKARILAESRIWHRYDLPPELVGKLWGGRYRGQAQKWFLMQFLGGDSDFNLDTEHPEFLAWRWAEIAELPDLIVPFKRQLYRDIIAEFSRPIAAIKAA